MKKLLVLSFLLPLLAFLTNLPLAFSDDPKPVLDGYKEPLLFGDTYFILPSIWGPLGGGLSPRRTGNSVCPLTVLQSRSEIDRGLPVIFTSPDDAQGVVHEGEEVIIEFSAVPICAFSSKWLVFVDETIGKSCVGIGTDKVHAGKETLAGKFKIEKYNIGYKFVFCESESSACSDIGRFDANNDENGRRLILTDSQAFDIVFIPTQRIIKSVA